MSKNMSTRMKPSGIEWIGDIPDGWDIKRIRFATLLRTEKGIYNPNKDIYIGLENVESSTGKLVQTESEYEEGFYDIFHKEDVLFGLLRPYLEKVFIAKFNGFCTGEFLILREYQGDKRYLFYFLLSHGFLEIVNASTYGAKMPRASWDYIRNLTILVFPIHEQQAIASFLDKQCEKINGIIADMEQQIEVLKQYKTALITEIVTKGLDKSALMNDSGIDWIGKIPAHWEVKPIKYSLLSNEKALKETTRDDYVIRYIDIGSVDFDNGITRYEEINFENAPSRARRVVKKGDTIISTVRTYLKAIARIVDDKDVIVSTGFAVFSPQKNDPIFVEYFCKSEGFCSEIEKFSYGIAYPAINESVLINIKIILPPIKEQKIIASYLDTKCKEITNIINDKQSSISTMNDYKKSLIYEYVTGKKRVTI